MMILTLLSIELRKLRGTLSPSLCLLAPALVALVAWLIARRLPDPGWTPLLMNSLGLWAYFILPMTVAALAALLAQIEHGPGSWDHLFALPISRMRLIVAKLAALMLLIAAMSALLILLCLALGVIGSSLAAGSFPWRMAAGLAASNCAASALMAVIQLWIALRFRSFVAPIGAGLAGTFVVVAAMGAPQSMFLPWAMPLATLGLAGTSATFALIAGGVGGILLAPLMALHLAYRDF